ncbi:MAG: TonB-dependent receptor [Mangrovibacterium sp.]
MNIRFYLLSFIFLFSQGLKGQSIRGVVCDGLQQLPLEGAAVVIPELKKGTVTDTRGEFVFSDLPEGEYLIRISFLGYGTVKQEVCTGTRTNVSLLPESYMQEQVVVTANKVETSRDQVPLTISTISREQIEQSGETNVLPVISRHVPGLFITERGISGFGISSGSAGKISIRGVGGSDSSFPVLVLIDGQPQFVGIFGHSIPDSYSSSDIEKAEIIRGPASILYGTNAMGGVINLITRKNNREGFSFRGNGMTGSHGTWKLNGSAACKSGKLSLLGSWNHDQTDGHRANSDFRLDNGFLKADYEFNQYISLTANASRSDFKAYDPGSIYEEDPSVYDNKSFWADIVRTNYYFTLSNKYEKAEGGLKVYYMHGDHMISNGPEEDWNSLDENLGFSFYQGLRLFPGNLISLGVESKKYGGQGSPVSGLGGELSSYNDRWISVTETGGYLIVQHELGNRLSINSGIRYEHHELFGSEWIPQFGAAYSLDWNTKLKASVSKGYRSPSVRELYLFPSANQDLLPERMWNYELGLTRYFLNRRLTTEMHLFLAKGDNLIMLVPNPSPPPQKQNKNSGDFSHKGIELEAIFRLSSKISLNSNYSYLDMDSPKVSAPRNQFFLGGDFHRGAFSFHTNIQYINHLYTCLDPEDTQTYLLAGAGLSYRINRNLKWSVSGENLLDTDYQTQYGYPMPGITVFTGLNINL